MRVARWNRIGVALGLVLAACGGDDGGSPPGPPTQLVMNGGDNQVWYFSNRLPSPYQVRALDANNRGVPGVIVTWAVASGNGTVAPLQDTTDATGVASAFHTLGSTGATQSVTATPSLGTLPTLTFTSSAGVPNTTAAISLASLRFNPDSVVIQTSGSVRWTWNDGATVHNITFVGGPVPLPAAADRSNGTYSDTLTVIGAYSYTCTNHIGMNGKVIVVN